ncbi:MAG: YggS family pyridoxal phosphate-dependent enzyme [Alteromonadaceae bacterium]|nr:YggS family pyridoxal phosphate-dependent enzyme [Alteromonadaceae bacterium]
MTNIKDNLVIIKQQIAHVCQLTHRACDEVSLLAVSKTKPASMIEQAYQAGQREFGESYLQESIEKVQQLKHLPDICWHFIGPIQSNKTRQIAENFSWVHSIDRIKIATRLNEHRSSQNTPLKVCIQVNISNEQTKSGVSTDELAELTKVIDQCSNLELRGLMAIPQKNAERAAFDKMYQLFNQLKQTHPQMDTLSMGMSGDMQDAIAAGSTMVRVGTAIFGSRN